MWCLLSFHEYLHHQPLSLPSALGWETPSLQLAMRAVLVLFTTVLFVLAQRGCFRCWVSRDVTAQKRAEAHTAWLAAIVENSSNICTLKDLNLRIVAANRAFLNLLGLESMAQITGKTDEEVFGASELVAQYMADERLAQTLSPGEEVIRDEALVLPNGEERHHHTRKFPVFDYRGALVATANISVDVTELKRQERQTATTARLLERLSDRVPGFMFQFQYHSDGRSHLPWASAGVREIFELSPEDVQRDADVLFQRIHPEDCQGVVDSIQASFQSLEPWCNEFRVCLPERGERWLSANSVPERLDDGIVLWHGHVYDVTERIAGERRIEELTTRLQLAAKAAQIGIYEFDLASGRAIVDDTMYRLYGLQPGEPTADFALWQSLVHPEDQGAMFQSLQDILRDADDYDTDFRVVWPDGAIRHLKSFGTVERNGAGEPVRIIGTNWDITAQKESERVLRESEERFRTLLQKVPNVAVQGYAADGTIHYWNEASERFYGYRAQEALGANMLDLIIPPDIRDEVRVKLRESAETGEPIESGEIPLMRRDGSTVVTFSSHAVVQTPGMPPSLYCLDIDLTEYKRLEGDLRQAQKMEAVGQLAGGIAHDFNNLLSAILGNCQLAQDIVPAGDMELLDHLDEIERGAQRAAALTRQLLVFSRRQAVSLVVANLNDIVENLLKLIRRTIGEHIELEFIPGPGLVSVHVDPGQIEQVLMNLCINARDAMSGGGRLTIETGNCTADDHACKAQPWARPGEFASIRVIDTGSGIEEQHLAHIFDPFFTTKEVGQGTGLGLATVYGIVQQHRGLIEVESSPGLGTTFIVHLPKVNALAAARTESPRQSLPRGGNEHILLAEDDDAIRKLTVHALMRVGYRVTAVINGRDAIEMLRNQPTDFDLALLDIVMPIEGGGAVASHIHHEGLNIPVLFMSGYSGQGLQGDLMEGFEAPIIRKPFGPSVLLERVRARLDANQGDAPQA
jgi:PAS domain S-box-containing protein